MDERDFELLRMLNDTKNITKAADRLFMTQSALSKRIMNIEKELGSEIMIRSRNGIHFTPVGEQVLMHAIKAAEEMEKMRSSIGKIRGEVSGTLKAGFSINYSQFVLPDLLLSYHRKYPEVHLELKNGQSRELFKQLVEGVIDVAVLRGDFQWDGTQILLGEEPICMIVSKEHKNRKLNDNLYVQWDTDASQAAMINRWLRENGVNPSASTVTLDSVTSCINMVSVGLGWSIIPGIGIKGFDGEVTECRFANGEPLTRKTYILCRPEMLELPQVKAFVDEAKKVRI